MTNRQIFLQHVAQTSPAPIGLELVKAQGCNMWDVEGNKFFDLISGFSVMNIGHSDPSVIAAIKKQIDDYMHLMVYGEIIQTPQVAYAQKLISMLPENLDCVYFTNSGAEATEGAMKLAKRFTGRSQIVAFKNSYHGSTQGALSILGDEYFRNAYRPLLPGIIHVDYNSCEAIDAITDETACIIMETVQAEAGVIAADPEWMLAIRQQCTETGTLLVLDEIQTGFGRTGTLWAFEQYGIVPDILLLGKALGGGLPLGAFISSQNVMNTLTHNPVLGHISTFAGHPVSCAAGLAAFEVLLSLKNDSLINATQEPSNADKSSFDLAFVVPQLAARFQSLLQHRAIKEVRSAGLLMAVEFEQAEVAQKIVHACVKAGLITDWFLFAPNCMRIAPPLVVTLEEIENVCTTILKVIEENI
jgi:acetylornithine/N-succinyldiaminopimelate aminotransferase